MTGVHNDERRVWSEFEENIIAVGRVCLFAEFRQSLLKIDNMFYNVILEVLW